MKWYGCFIVSDFQTLRQYQKSDGKHQLNAENVDFFLIHQANKLIVDRIVKS